MASNSRLVALEARIKVLEAKADEYETALKLAKGTDIDKYIGLLQSANQHHQSATLEKVALINERVATISSAGQTMFSTELWLPFLSSFSLSLISSTKNSRVRPCRVLLEKENDSCLESDLPSVFVW
ncbi:hypothetical protein BDR26DRAFT_1004054 [Obelidium mucronatum]|nr:hypothetical protein BDR26DRAFT_1004054 [Obelidium mucronatum]